MWISWWPCIHCKRIVLKRRNRERESITTRCLWQRPKPGTRTKYGRNVLPAADIEGEGSERDMTAADLSIHTIHLPRLDGCGICAEKVVVV